MITSIRSLEGTCKKRDSSSAAGVVVEPIVALTSSQGTRELGHIVVEVSHGTFTLDKVYQDSRQLVVTCRVGRLSEVVYPIEVDTGEHEAPHLSDSGLHHHARSLREHAKGEVARYSGDRARPASTLGEGSRSEWSIGFIGCPPYGVPICQRVSEPK